MRKSDTLIHTKLQPPFVRQNLVPRHRLQAQVVAGLEGPLTLVIAPAGFGKTTLVTASLSSIQWRMAWLSLERDDNRAGSFVKYLVAALHEANPAIGNEAVQLLAGLQQASDEAVLTSLINDLDMVGQEIILVLDDYQFISSEAVHAQVTFLLEHCPHNLHLLIATRSDPPLPLARLRARGQLVELRAADLRFTLSEATQFLNDVMGLCLDTSSVAQLEQRTEGWVAGLQMAALSIRDRQDRLGFIEGFSGTNRHIVDYLLEEILSHQSPEVQRFLLITSTMERLMAPLCDALLAIDEQENSHPRVADFHDSASILEYLERENLFLISLDDKRMWFRYHHLFADLLKARLQHTQPDLIPLLHIRASLWLEKNGFIHEAIQHLLAAQETERAAELIERYGPAHWEETDPSIMHMADSLPPEVLTTRTRLRLYQAWLIICEGHILKVMPLLDELARQLAMAAPVSGERWMQTFITLAQIFLTPQAHAAKLPPLPDQQALDEVPIEEPILRDAAHILYVLTLNRRGAIDRAEEITSGWVRKKKIAQAALDIPALVAFLARIYFIQGRLSAAAALCQDYLAPLKEKASHFVYNAANMLIVLGEVFYERNDLEEAEKHIRDGLQANEPWKNILTDAFGLIALIRLLLAKGDHEQAMQTVDRLEERLQEPSQPIEFHEELRILRPRVQLASGDLQAASRWADQISLSEDYRLHEDYYRLTLARIHLAQGKHAHIEERLSRERPASRSGNQVSREIETRLLLAAAITAQQRLSDALPLIEYCLALAEPEGYIRIFLDIGDPIRDLLTSYLRSAATAHRPYAEKVLKAFPPRNERCILHPQPIGLIEPLSAREIEVLQLLSLGYTNQVIAQQLIVAPGTIKAHTASIYRKLDVSNRTEAVSRARQLGILP